MDPFRAFEVATVAGARKGEGSPLPLARISARATLGAQMPEMSFRLLLLSLGALFCLGAASAQEVVAAAATREPDPAPAAEASPVGAALRVPDAFGKPRPQGMGDLRAMQEHQRRLAAQLRSATCTILLEGGAGSAEFLTPDGLIASAAHVTGPPGNELKVVLADGTELDAVALTADTEIDGSFAMILPGQLRHPLPYLRMAELGEPKAGDWCMVCGNSGGWDAQRGSVIRVGRLVRVTPGEIQSDTTLIGGDSGGPAVDMRGRFLGSNSRVGMTARFSLHVPLDYYHENLAEAQQRFRLVAEHGVAAFQADLAREAATADRGEEESRPDEGAGGDGEASGEEEDGAGPEEGAEAKPADPAGPAAEAGPAGEPGEAAAPAESAAAEGQTPEQPPAPAAAAAPAGASEAPPAPFVA